MKRSQLIGKCFQLLRMSFSRCSNGDWVEKTEMKVPAPEDFSWGSFKAAISLLYGEQVQVEESFIPDIYGVAHFYDLREVISVLVHEVRQWDYHLLDTVVELCILAEGRPERDNNSVLHTAIQYIARHLEQVNPLDIARLSYETMMKLVQSEDITITELAFLRVMDQWMNAHSDITVKQMRELFSHIRFGTIPLQSLTECSAIGHDHLKSALETHQQLLVDRVRSNMVQVTPRLSQKEVFQVYPFSVGIRVDQQNEAINVQYLTNERSVGIVYCGKQDIKFDLEMEMETFVCQLFSLRAPDVKVQAEKVLHLSTSHNTSYLFNSPRRNTLNGKGDFNVNGTLRFKRCTVVLSHAGAHFTLKSTDQLSSDDDTLCVTRTMDLPFTGCFPWVLAFGMRGHNAQVFSIYPPTL